MSLKILLLVGAGSFIGGIFRYLISFMFVHKQPHAFPWGTLIVNIFGSLLIGILIGYADRWHFPKEMRLFLATGVLGGFTTFSTFSSETFILFHNGYCGYALAYVLASIVIGIGAGFLGFYMMRL
jgi:CrcB protein